MLQKKVKFEMSKIGMDTVWPECSPYYAASLNTNKLIAVTQKTIL